MTSIIKLHALSGSCDESPPCYILQVDEFRFMLDCGWNETFDDRLAKELRRYSSQVDAVLLSYPDPSHLGALPYAVSKCDLNCPIYATVPVYKMGQMFMYDLYQSRYSMEDFNLFTLDDVDTTFDRITQVKYSQTICLKGKGFGISITALPAGHMIGGTIWKIMKEEEEDIIYAVDYNHKKERHLNSCELDKISRPSLLITDTYNVLYHQARRRIRDEKLMTNILQTLRNGGNVLIAVDTAGRVLELVHMLDQLWRNKDSGLLAYSLALLNNVSYNVVEFAKSQIEWMSDKLMKSFEGARNNPFQFKHVKLCHSLNELNKVPSPKVVLASTPDMECGFSREIFLQWASKPNNSIILTSRTSAGTLAQQLMDLSGGSPFNLNLEVKKRVRLEGNELEEYKANEKESKVVNGDAYVELSSDSEDELLKGEKGKHDLLVRPLIKQQRLTKNKKRWPMYPFFEEKVKYDDYGEFLKEGECKVIDISNDYKEIFPALPVKDEHQQEEDDMQIDMLEVPTKCISFVTTISVEAHIQFIDFEGRSDGESVKKIVSSMKPRRLVLVRGSQECTTVMLEYCQRYMDAKIYAPKLGEVVDVTMESHIYQVRLTDMLLSSLNLQKYKDGELAWLDAHVLEEKTTEHMDEDAAEIDKKLDNVYSLEPLPLSRVTGHQPTFINELKLSDFKQVLSKLNISTEMLGGVLYCCDGTIAVRRIEQGKVVLEGCLSDEFYAIRELLYKQYAII